MCLKKYLFAFLIFIIIISPISSFADDFTEENVSENLTAISVSTDLTNYPSINSRHAIILDRASTTVLFGKKENEICKMASTTKIMTCIITLENINNLQEIVTVSKKAAGTGGSRLGLSTNDTITVENLLYGLMMVSGNDAAVCLAEYVAGSIENFSELMNKKAFELGLTSTHFVSPHGLDHDEHYTTAYELAVLSNYALKNKKFSQIVNTSNYTITINNSSKTLHNTNELLRYIDGVYGIKTGFTNGANRCLVSACKRENLDVICVVLGCDTKKDRTRDSIELINYAFNNFTTINIKDKIESDFKSWQQSHQNCFDVTKGLSSKLNLNIDFNKLPYEQIAIGNSYLNTVNTEITYTSQFSAPLKPNSIIGQINMLVNNNPILSLDFINENYIDKKDTKFYFINILKNYCKKYCLTSI